MYNTYEYHSPEKEKTFAPAKPVGGIKVKRLLALVLILIVLSSIASSSPLQQGFIGLYADNQRTYHVYCPFEGPSVARVEMWIWCLPSVDGQLGAEFRIEYPLNVIQSTVTPNDAIIAVELGSLPEGISVAYSVCQFDWNCPYHQTLWITSHDMTEVRIVSHPEVGVYQFISCLPDFPPEQCIILSDLLLNNPGGSMIGPCKPPDDLIIETKNFAWGAIKSIFRE